MESEKKALLIFMAINKTFSSDNQYSLSEYGGRINLYCFLLCQIFNKPLIEQCLDFVCETSTGKSMAVKNILIPNTLEELNVRLKFLWSSITDIHTVAMEGQKRQTCSIWNEMGLQVTVAPIPGFFSFSLIKPLTHRPTPNSDLGSGGIQMMFSLKQSSKLFFQRTGKAIETHCYPLHGGAGGVTTLTSWALKTESKNCAEKNVRVQQRLANAYLVEVISSVMADPHLLNCVIVPTQEEEQSGKALVEKDLLKQNVMQRFNIMEKFADKAHENGGANETMPLYQAWESDCQTYLKHFLDCPVPPGVTNKAMGVYCQDPKGATATSKAAQKFLTEALRFDKEFDKDAQREKWHYSDPANYGPFSDKLAAVMYPPPKDKVDVREAGISGTLANRHGAFLVAHVKINHQTQSAQKFNVSWSNKEYQLLYTTAAHASFNVPSCTAFRQVIENNGTKDTQNYHPTLRYVHECHPHKDPVDEVRTLCC